MSKKTITKILSVLLILAVIAYIVCIFAFIFSGNDTLVIIGGCMLFAPVGVILIFMITLICVNVVQDLVERRCKDEHMQELRSSDQMDQDEGDREGDAG